MEKEIIKIEETGKTPRLFLHSCCAPCSSYCIEYLSQYFSITVFYYNPNIYPGEEYKKRVIEQQEFIKKFPTKNPLDFIEGEFDTDKFYKTVKGYENCEEGGQRCFLCYRLRLEETAKYAAKGNFDYFTTTLSISPMKNAAKLNETGLELEREYGVKYLCSDFKKKNGYKRSVEISNEYGMYRQNYCGCVFSRRDSLSQ